MLPHEHIKTDDMRQRIVEFLGGRTLERATCVNLSNSRGFKDSNCVVKAAKYLDYFIEYEKDFSRSLLDRDHLLIDLDMEYVNFDFQAEPYLDRIRAFAFQQPATASLRSMLEAYGIKPLCVMTGRGYHFVWTVKQSSKAFCRLAHLGRLTPEMRQRYRLQETAVSVRVGNAFSGAGMMMEYLMHRFLRRSDRSTDIPTRILEVTIAPQQRGREIICLDISEYADPLHTRFIRSPFSIYLKPYWKKDILTPQIKDRIPLITVLPVVTNDFRAMVQMSQNLNDVQKCAAGTSAAIPDFSNATEALITDYEASSLRRFHDYFYEQQHEPAANWPQTYDRTPLDFLPPCVRYILEHPNEWLLVPGAIRLVTAVLMSTNWHPRHIAGLIRSKYERDYGWLNEWYVYDAATRADFYTRVFAGLIRLKQDTLEDLNCHALRRAGLCRQPAMGCRTEVFADFLARKEQFV